MSNPFPGSNRRKSLRQHKVDGTFRAGRHSDFQNPEPASGRPEVPAGLPDVARREWDRLVTALEAMGALHTVDGFVLEQHVKLYAETEAISAQQAEVRGSLAILEATLPDLEKSEIVECMRQMVILRQLAARATDQLRSGRLALRQFLQESGLTPVSRGRIKLPTRADAPDALETFKLRRLK